MSLKKKKWLRSTKAENERSAKASGKVMPREWNLLVENKKSYLLKLLSKRLTLSLSWLYEVETLSRKVRNERILKIQQKVTCVFKNETPRKENEKNNYLLKDSNKRIVFNETLNQARRRVASNKMMASPKHILLQLCLGCRAIASRWSKNKTKKKDVCRRQSPPGPKERRIAACGSSWD